MSLEQILAAVRVSGWDPAVLMSCAETLFERLPQAPEVLKQELRWAIQHAWEQHFPIADNDAFAGCLATLLFQLEDYAEALNLYAKAGPQAETDPASAYNIALCHFRLHQPSSALEFALRALTLDPGFEQARALRVRLESELGRNRSAPQLATLQV
jgi:tetratricopeptide (TPR) repeat protein